MATVQVRYIVNDVDAAIAFYCQHLGFHEEMHPAPAKPVAPVMQPADGRLMRNIRVPL